MIRRTPTRFAPSTLPIEHTQIVRVNCKILCLDDSRDFAQALANSISMVVDDLRVVFSTSPKEVEDLIAHEREQWGRAIERLAEHIADCKRTGLKTLTLFPDAQAAPLGVLVIDAMMPAMRGISLAKRLEGSLTRNVLISGVAGDSHPLQCLNSGYFTGFIPKGSISLREDIDAHISRAINSLTREIEDRALYLYLR